MLKYLNMEEFINNLATQNSEKDARLTNVISLAFVGDALYSSFIRVRLANTYSKKAGDLHKQANKFVNAKSQALVLSELKEKNIFNQTELDLLRRARNSHLTHVAKNASIEEYKLATCFEAVLGYLFFSNQKTRLIDIMDMAYQITLNL